MESKENKDLKRNIHRSQHTRHIERDMTFGFRTFSSSSIDVTVVVVVGVVALDANFVFWEWKKLCLFFVDTSNNNNDDDNDERKKKTVSRSN